MSHSIQLLSSHTFTFSFILLSCAKCEKKGYNMDKLLQNFQTCKELRLDDSRGPENAGKLQRISPPSLVSSADSLPSSVLTIISELWKKKYERYKHLTIKAVYYNSYVTIYQESNGFVSSFSFRPSLWTSSAVVDLFDPTTLTTAAINATNFTKQIQSKLLIVISKPFCTNGVKNGKSFILFPWLKRTAAQCGVKRTRPPCLLWGDGEMCVLIGWLDTRCKNTSLGYF